MSDANANNDAVKTSAPPSTAGGASAAVEDRRRDPAMRALYQMSRTAGVGLQDYAAVNNLAVIGVFCAIIAALLYLLLWEVPIYPFFVAAGLILGVVSFVQIAKSNGTQTGKGIAIAAALLSLVVGGYAGVRGAMIAAEDKRHVASIGQVIAGLGESVKTQDWKRGYGLMDEAFQKRVSADEFQTKLGFVRSYQGMTIDSFAIKPESTRIVRDTAGNVSAETLLFIRLADSAGKVTEPGSVPCILFPYGAEWKIHDIPDLFAPPKKTR